MKRSLWLLWFVALALLLAACAPGVHRVSELDTNPRSIVLDDTDPWSPHTHPPIGDPGGGPVAPGDPDSPEVPIDNGGTIDGPAFPVPPRDPGVPIDPDPTDPPIYAPPPGLDPPASDDCKVIDLPPSSNLERIIKCPDDPADLVCKP